MNQIEKKVHLICLFRSDSNVDINQEQKRISKIGLNKNIHCIWKSLKPEDLSIFINECYAVILPFLLVPSEIPLAIIEAAGFGKPVISTAEGGTGEFVDKFGLTIKPNSIKELMNQMKILLENDSIYKQKCKNAKNIYDYCPTWEEVAEKWESLTERDEF